MLSLVLQFSRSLGANLQYSLPQRLGDGGVTAKFQALEILENHKTSSHTPPSANYQGEILNYNSTFKLEF